MIIEDIPSFVTALPPTGALAGLDFGDKTIGIALSDRLRGTATPMETIRRRKFTLDAARLMEVMAELEATGIVLGLPRNMDGSEGPRCQKTRAFARNLTQITDIPITFWDERLSTVAAERALLEADTSRRRRAEVIDHVAAAYILQGALDRIAHLARETAREGDA
ncbi:Holliday junction resolvase RuvX [Marinibacterium profundimaris]|uniref:Putative pre-16S rRNA nuclease n=1 Tax=Marinibacterium profundimaris TaxID=1679460 RepID=A0A225NQT7_9RHOB|nr:Holliday junction resolvase RuvX [Marinibacterium profundimaris]OWU77219.1 Holliday junction resolvase [Marinibacterium profundimaris]